MIHLNIGQCGNQIGAAFWNLAWDLNEKVANNPFFDEYKKAHCILVDSEPKVIATAIEATRTNAELHDRFGFYRKENVIKDQSGRGNNFALGYLDPFASEETSLLYLCENAIRLEAERCDMFSGFNICHSTSGGTGSGFTSRILEILFDDYPKQSRFTVSVFPCLDASDTCLQSLNSVLCLSRLLSCSDGVFAFSNDTMLRNCTSMVDFNNNIALNMWNIYAPWSLSSYIGKSKKKHVRAFSPFEFLNIMMASPWDKIFEVSLRTPNKRTPKLSTIDHLFIRSATPVPQENTTNCLFLGQEMSTMCTRLHLKQTKVILDRAKLLFDNRAYIHHVCFLIKILKPFLQYTKYGLEEEEFLYAFEILSNC